jgi:hypothetical protein
MDIERTIQFIIEQQAEFASDIQLIKEAIQAQQEQSKTQQAQLSQLTAMVLDLATSHERTNEIVAVLAERQVNTEEALNKVAQSLAELAATVDRHIAGHK